MAVERRFRGSAARARSASATFCCGVVLCLCAWLAGDRVPHYPDIPGALVVVAVTSRSRAAAFHFRAGDRLLTCGGRPLPSPAALYAAWDNTRRGEVEL